MQRNGLWWRPSPRCWSARRAVAYVDTTRPAKWAHPSRLGLVDDLQDHRQISRVRLIGPGVEAPGFQAAGPFGEPRTVPADYCQGVTLAPERGCPCRH